MNDVFFTGGTEFVIAALRLGYLLSAGDFYTPGQAMVPADDAEAFEELLIEAKIPFVRKPS